MMPSNCPTYTWTHHPISEQVCLHLLQHSSVPSEHMTGKESLLVQKQEGPYLVFVININNVEKPQQSLQWY